MSLYPFVICSDSRTLKLPENIRVRQTTFGVSEPCQPCGLLSTLPVHLTTTQSAETTTLSPLCLETSTKDSTNIAYQITMPIHILMHFLTADPMLGPGRQRSHSAIMNFQCLPCSRRPLFCMLGCYGPLSQGKVHLDMSVFKCFCTRRIFSFKSTLSHQHAFPP
jgi:hypothetical protein